MIKYDLTRLVGRPPAEKRLDPAVAPAAMPEKTGLERKIRAGGVELNIEEVTVTSTDGLFTFVVNVLNP